MAGRKRYHPHCPNKTGWEPTVVNVYVRIGSPSKWTVIGEVCLNCNKFSPTDGAALAG